MFLLTTLEGDSLYLFIEVIIESKNHHLENDKICKGIKKELI